MNLIHGRIAIGQTVVSKETMALMLLERRADITYNGARYMAISTQQGLCEAAEKES